jgi:hypothetical protein
MARAEQEGQPYLFRLRATANVKRALERAMAERDWSDAGQGWQGKETKLRLMGWSRQRRVVLLRRKFNRPLALLDRTDPRQPLLGFAEVLGGKREVWEYAALVTSLDSEILTLGQLYRDRADCENAFDELKNHWGWGGFTTQDLKRCRLLAASVALIYNWWSLFVRLADPDQHREVITSRPLLLQAIARKTQHAGRTTLTVSSTHCEQQAGRRAYLRIARFFASLREKAEQLESRPSSRNTRQSSARPRRIFQPQAELPLQIRCGCTRPSYLGQQVAGRSSRHMINHTLLASPKTSVIVMPIWIFILSSSDLHDRVVIDLTKFVDSRTVYLVLE